MLPLQSHSLGSVAYAERERDGRLKMLGTSKGGVLDMRTLRTEIGHGDDAIKVAADAIAELRDAADMLSIHCPDGHFGSYISGEADKLECRLKMLS